MIVKTLSVRNFRNHSYKELEFSNGINVITGMNTAGKTNIVEAIYYLSLARSFRGVDDEDIINRSSEYAEIDSLVVEGSLKRKIHIIITKKGRSVLVNGKKVSKLSDLSKCVNVLLFEPKDVLLFRGHVPPPQRQAQYMLRHPTRFDCDDIHSRWRHNLKPRTAAGLMCLLWCCTYQPFHCLMAYQGSSCQMGLWAQLSIHIKNSVSARFYLYPDTVFPQSWRYDPVDRI